MAFHSVNLNPPRGPRGGGGGRGGGSGNRYASNNSGYNTPPLRIDASGRVDQGFGPVGGVAAASDPDFDIFGIDEPSTFQAQQQSAPNPQPIFNNAPRGRGRGRGAFNYATSRDGYQQQGGNFAGDASLEVQIRGWDGADNRNDVIAFLSRKFGIQVQNQRFSGQILFCSAPSPTAYQTLLNANGVRFAGKSLQIQPSQNRGGYTGNQNQGTGFQSQHTQTTYEILKGFLSRRYNAEIGLLDLSNLAADETLQGSGFFNSTTTQAKLFPALMKVADQNIPKQGVGVVSVSLAENGLRDVFAIRGLADAFPNLKNLSLQQNGITRWNDLEAWAEGPKQASRFPQLQELLLLDNPIQRNARSADEYQSEIAKRFPSLKMLDGIALPALVKGIRFDVDTTNKAPSGLKVDLPGKIRQGAWGEGSNEIGVGFLSLFFHLYDSDRQTLLQQYYTPTSLFSLSVDTLTPHAPTHHRRNAFSGQNQTPSSTNLSGYLPQSRNLLRTNGAQARATRLHNGRDQIAQAFRVIPRTRHPIDDPAAFVADGFQVQIGSTAGIMVSVHGEFYEQSDRGGEHRRSFDRTFLLGPPAQTNPGSQCVVVSDLLVLRPWSGRDAWVPEDNAVAPAASGVDPQALVEEMRRRTGMNEQYTRMLLEECRGDLEAGMRRFGEAKAQNQIPAEAFQ